MREGGVQSLTQCADSWGWIGGGAEGVPYLVDGRGLAVALPKCGPGCCCAGDSCAAVADIPLEGVRGGRLVTTSPAAAGGFKSTCSVCCVPASGN